MKNNGVLTRSGKVISIISYYKINDIDALKKDLQFEFKKIQIYLSPQQESHNNFKELAKALMGIKSSYELEFLSPDGNSVVDFEPLFSKPDSTFISKLSFNNVAFGGRANPSQPKKEKNCNILANYLEQNTWVKSLSLKNTDLSEQEIMILMKAVNKRRELKTLEIDTCENVRLNCFASLADNEIIETLNLRHLYWQDDQDRRARIIEPLIDFANMLGLNKSIKNLSLVGVIRDDECARILSAGLAAHTNITSLDLSYTQFTEVGAGLIAKSLGGLKDLTYLKLTDIAPNGKEEIFRSLLKNDNLLHLDIDDTGVDKALCNKLAEKIKDNNKRAEELADIVMGIGPGLKYQDVIDLKSRLGAIRERNDNIRAGKEVDDVIDVGAKLKYQDVIDLKARTSAVDKIIEKRGLESKKPSARFVSVEDYLGKLTKEQIDALKNEYSKIEVMMLLTKSTSFLSSLPPLPSDVVKGILAKNGVQVKNIVRKSEMLANKLLKGEKLTDKEVVDLEFREAEVQEVVDGKVKDEKLVLPKGFTTVKQYIADLKKQPTSGLSGSAASVVVEQGPKKY